MRSVHRAYNESILGRSVRPHVSFPKKYRIPIHSVLDLLPHNFYCKNIKMHLANLIWFLYKQYNTPPFFACSWNESFRLTECKNISLYKNFVSYKSRGNRHLKTQLTIWDIFVTKWIFKKNCKECLWLCTVLSGVCLALWQQRCTITDVCFLQKNSKANKGRPEIGKRGSGSA